MKVLYYFAVFGSLVVLAHHTASWSLERHAHAQAQEQAHERTPASEQSEANSRLN